MANAMTPKELFLVWAPADSVWSPWAKPVPFAEPKTTLSLDLPTDLPTVDAPSAEIDMSGILPVNAGNPKVCLIVDLPGVEAVEAGLSLAKLGYRPVPLFNSSNGVNAVVPVTPIVKRLSSGADILRGLPIDPTAPPAFLLDSNRISGLLPPRPGYFDNRWVVFPQDFPSALILRSQQIEQVIVLQRQTSIHDDLVNVLLQLQAAQMKITIKNASTGEPPAELPVRRPSRFNFWARALQLLALQGRRSNAAGFGAVIPTPGEGRGFGG